jgi:hypothetical protein
MRSRGSGRCRPGRKKEKGEDSYTFHEPGGQDGTPSWEQGLL